MVTSRPETGGRKNCSKCGLPMKLITRSRKDGIGTPQGDIWNTATVEEWVCTGTKCFHTEDADVLGKPAVCPTHSKTMVRTNILDRSGRSLDGLFYACPESGCNQRFETKVGYFDVLKDLF